MAKPKIDAQEAVRDIRSGMDDILLMRKYGLTPKGLGSLLSKLLQAGAIKRSDVGPNFKMEVKAKDVLTDIRAGMSRDKLTKKYRLSLRGLQSLLTKLVRAGAVKRPEIERWLSQASRKAPAQPEPSSEPSEIDQWMSSFEETVDLTWMEKEHELG